MEAVLAYHANSALEIQDVIISFLDETKGKEFTEDYISQYKTVYGSKLAEGSKTINEAKAELVNDMVGELFATEEGFKEFTDWLLDTDKVDTKQKKHVINSIKKIINDVIEFFKDFLNVAPMNEATAAVIEMEAERAKEIRKMALEAFDKISQTLAEGNVESEAESSKGEVRNSVEVSDDIRVTAEDVLEVRSIGRKFVTQFNESDLSKSEKWAKKFNIDIKEKSPFFRAWFGDWRQYDTTPLKIANIPKYTDSNEFRKSNRGNYLVKDTVIDGKNNSGWIIAVSRDGETNTISHSGNNKLSEYGLAGIRNLVENSILLDTEVHEHHRINKENEKIAFDHKFYAFGKSDNGEIALYKITVEDYFQSSKEAFKKRFHNLRYIEKIAENIGGRTFDKSRSGGSTNDISTIYSVADLFDFVKKYDPEFKPNPVHPSALNKDGTPKIFYHGSPYQFEAFDKSKAKKSGYYGSGFYFSDSKEQSITML